MAPHQNSSRWKRSTDRRGLSRATPRLGREVAIKVLPVLLLAVDPDRVRRCE
jgi:hypothetical protein